MNRPKWIERWVDRVKGKFPQLTVFDFYWPSKDCWVIGFRYKGSYLALGLNPSQSPAVRHNRKSFRDAFDRKLAAVLKQRGDRQWHESNI